MHIPVSKQHRHIHSSKDEDDMEPGILKGVTRGGTIQKEAYIITSTRTLIITQIASVVVIVIVVVIKCRTWNSTGKAFL